MATRQGQIADGTVRLGLQVPTELSASFREEMARLGVQSVRIGGTAAISLYLCLPRSHREKIHRYIHLAMTRQKRTPPPEEIRSVLGRLDQDPTYEPVADPQFE